MNQQKRFQSNTEFIINLISLFLAHTLSIAIFGVIIKRITPYPKNDTIEYIFVLLISACETSYIAASLSNAKSALA